MVVKARGPLLTEVLAFHSARILTRSRTTLSTAMSAVNAVRGWLLLVHRSLGGRWSRFIRSLKLEHVTVFRELLLLD
jgi:hypothetical protein